MISWVELFGSQRKCHRTALKENPLHGQAWMVQCGIVGMLCYFRHRVTSFSKREFCSSSEKQVISLWGKFTCSWNCSKTMMWCMNQCVLLIVSRAGKTKLKHAVWVNMPYSAEINPTASAQWGRRVRPQALLRHIARLLQPLSLWAPPEGWSVQCRSSVSETPNNILQ